MNWLAHLYLARHSDAALLGALLGDFAAGSNGLERFGRVEHAEILLHRRIDRFTDTHPDVTALRAQFPEGHRRFAGVVLDVYFDHLLSRDWPTRAPAAPPLDAFTARVYDVLRERHADLPPRLQAIAPRMAASDWLGSYRERDSVDRAVTRMAGRLSRQGERLVATLDDLRRVEPLAEATFDAFFPDLERFVTRTREG
ncbi:ACP phosphodiesterase [Cognatilysobacter segetis]|uniref:acyl carrier protein phosphodiesterase n=1 Tax=Cognatilysobacter segetis TaxID=2492394 RepID=UPI00105F9731|nr:ACP phosphodiesterase [Lysobacter segetis]